MGVFQEKVTSQNLALGNAGQIAKGTHGYLNVNSAIAATDISVGEFAQSSTNENEVKATKGATISGDILGVILRDSLKNSNTNVATDEIKAGDNVRILDNGSVYIETDKIAQKGEFVLIKESTGELEFRANLELLESGYKYTGFKVFIDNETENKGVVGITTAQSKDEIAKSDIRTDDFLQVLENGANAIITANSVEFTGANQGVLFQKNATKIRFTLPSAGPQSVYFGVKAQKVMSDEGCFFQGIVLNSSSMLGIDNGWNDFVVGNPYMRDNKKGVFDEASTRDWQSGDDAGHIVANNNPDAGKGFSHITEEGTGATIEITRNGADFTIKNVGTGATMTFGRWQFTNFRGNDLEYRFGFFTRSYNTKDDYKDEDLEWYRSLPGIQPVKTISDVKDDPADGPSPCGYAKGAAAYKITNIEILETAEA